MKRCVIIWFILILSACSLGALQLVKAFPGGLHISWEAVDGADYYDVYLDREPIIRVQKTNLHLTDLEDYRSYQVIVAARKTGNIDVAAFRSEFTTSGWEGAYRWINTTNKDNDGKCRQLDFFVIHQDGSYTIYGMYQEDYHRLCPLVDTQLIGIEIPYEGSSAHQRAYRANSEVFNTTSFTPKSWKVTEYMVEDKQIRTKVQTKVGALSFTTTSVYSFGVNEDGKRQLIFDTKGTGLASWGLFNSPNSGDGKAFICTETSDHGDISFLLMR